MTNLRTAILALVACLALAGCDRQANSLVPEGLTVVPGPNASHAESVDAETELANALAAAKLSDRVVFVHLSAPG